MTDYATRRTVMVDTQVRPSDVTKFPIIDAMLSVPREAFVPQLLREAAYLGENLDIAEGRVVLDPRVLAKMLDALDIQPEDLVLDIGPAYGYSSAIIAHMAEAVVGVEPDAELAEEAQRILSEHDVDNVLVQQADLTAGAPEHGPYDAVAVQGGIECLPDAIAAQIKDGGRIACIFMHGTMGVVRIGYKYDGQITWRESFDAGAPVLPGFEKKSEFAL